MHRVKDVLPDVSLVGTFYIPGAGERLTQTQKQNSVNYAPKCSRPFPNEFDFLD